MTDTKQYNKINWSEGMDVDLKMFEQTENHFTQAIANGATLFLNRNRFGLLPASKNDKLSEIFNVGGDNSGRITIRLNQCRAITLGGIYIDIDGKLQDVSVVQNLSLESIQETRVTPYWDIVLTANPYERMPMGTPDIEEQPPRHPHAGSSYKLSIVTKDSLDTAQFGSHHILLGRIRYFDNRFTVDDKYIPPCMSMSSHAILLQYLETFGARMNDIALASEKIIAKIRDRNQNSSIATHIGAICQDMLRYIASIYFRFRNEGQDAAPITIVDYISSFAHLCHMNLNFIGKADKEELLKYFHEWSDIKPGEFEEMLSTAMSISYNHNDIRGVMMQLDGLLRIISALWIRMSTLEYIGQHKENIVIGERMQEAPEQVSKSSWVIID